MFFSFRSFHTPPTFDCGVWLGLGEERGRLDKARPFSVLLTCFVKSGLVLDEVCQALVNVSCVVGVLRC